jgi:hypothetical protein
MGLIDLNAPLEPDPVIEAYKKDVDRTLLRENLKLTVEQRIEKLQRALKVVEEAKRAGREARSRR